MNKTQAIFPLQQALELAEDTGPSSLIEHARSSVRDIAIAVQLLAKEVRRLQAESVELQKEARVGSIPYQLERNRELKTELEKFQELHSAADAMWTLIATRLLMHVEPDDTRGVVFADIDAPIIRALETALKPLPRPAAEE